MSDNKAEATYHGEELPRRTPLESLGDWGQSQTSPAPPVVPGRPMVSPGPAPWDSQVHQDLAVQHGWATPGRVYSGRASSTLAVWALVTGCVGVLAGWCLLGLPCIAAVILGHLAVSETKDDRKSGRGMAVAGLVLGYVALIPAVILFFWMVAGGLLGGGAAVVTPLPSSTF